MNPRTRTWLRGILPGFLGRFFPKVEFCGDHEWYRSSPGLFRCYHCEAARIDSRDYRRRGSMEEAA